MFIRLALKTFIKDLHPQMFCSSKHRKFSCFNRKLFQNPLFRKYSQSLSSALETCGCKTNQKVYRQFSIKQDVNKLNKFTTRTHTCGELRKSDVGLEVQLYGWIEYHRMGKFVILRDSYGSTQLIIPESRKDLIDLVQTAPLESVLHATGTTKERPSGLENAKMVTGEIEVLVHDLEILSKASSVLPFHIKKFNKAGEALQMKHRYLSLRMPHLQRNLRLRSEVIMKMREFLINNCGFIDVETPTLFRRTPGGAQEFIVPTQIPNRFYSLVQSPQQFKQLLMVGGIDRYFQIARCYRDEATRPDRQPEFTQLDIEMSFCNENSIMTLIEELLAYCWPEDLDKISIPFPRLNYEDAMHFYGTDKPDMCYDIKLQDITKELRTNSSNDSKLDRVAAAVIFPNGASYLKAALKRISANKEYYPAVDLHVIKETSDEGSKNLRTNFSDSGISNIFEKLKPNFGDLLIISVGPKKQTLEFLGRIRQQFAKDMESHGDTNIRVKGIFKFAWIVNFPLFLPGDFDGQLEPAHHPFTQPHPEDLHLLPLDPLKVRGLHYDLVLNGVEVGGGSMRIHNPELQKLIFDSVLNFKSESMKYFFKALQSGCPPHGGIALGLDRLLATMCQANSIKEVIAFPKSYDGKDPMSDAPSTITDEEKNIYHIQSIQKLSSKAKIPNKSS